VATVAAPPVRPFVRRPHGRPLTAVGRACIHRTVDWGQLGWCVPDAEDLTHEIGMTYHTHGKNKQSESFHGVEVYLIFFV
jgi:hypothetical protein